MRTDYSIRSESIACEVPCHRPRRLGSANLTGADQLADEYKYVPVRRTALFIEESLYRGTQWVVFEPNDEPLWAQIRLTLARSCKTCFARVHFRARHRAKLTS